MKPDESPVDLAELSLRRVIELLADLTHDDDDGGLPTRVTDEYRVTFDDLGGGTA